MKKILYSFSLVLILINSVNCSSKMKVSENKIDLTQSVSDLAVESLQSEVNYFSLSLVLPNCSAEEPKLKKLATTIIKQGVISSAPSFRSLEYGSALFKKESGQIKDVNVITHADSLSDINTQKFNYFRKSDECINEEVVKYFFELGLEFGKIYKIKEKVVEGYANSCKSSSGLKSCTKNLDLKEFDKNYIDQEMFKIRYKKLKEYKKSILRSQI